MSDPSLPVLILVLGALATGKTALAQTLAPQRARPMLSKDTLKEQLCDAPGCPTLQHAQQDERASMGLLYQFAAALLAVGHACMIESPMHPNYATRDRQTLYQQHPYRLVQLHCVLAQCPAATMRAVHGGARATRDTGIAGAARLQPRSARARHFPLTDGP